LPQAIAHRGFKAEHPENTMASFKGAVNVGAHAIETDIHLTKDGVVVLSHDLDLKRCFGSKEKIIECDWDHLSTFRTLKEPHVPMPRLQDLLEYVSQPDLQHIWLFLDIKLDNNADDVMRLIAKTLADVHPGDRSWNDRIILGIWAAKYLALCDKYLPGFPVAHIGFSTIYARQFLKVPNVSFSILQRSLFGPFGSRFMRDVRKANRELYAWTVNDTNLMKWCCQHGLAGVITDDPKRFKKICDEWDDKKERRARQTLYQWMYTVYVWALILVFSRSFWRRFPETVESYVKEKNLRAKMANTVEKLS
jgi:glycerophosphoryl diester phosphodiesterase